MAAPDVLPPLNPIPALLRDVGFRQRRRGYGSATQLLWNRLEGAASLYELCQASGPLTSLDRAILDQCRQKLELARRCLDKPFGRWSFSFWEVIHEVDGLLLLVMPQHMLLPKALEIQHQFEQRVTSPVQCRLWLGADKTCGPLPRCVRRLARMDDLASEPAAYPPLEVDQLEHCRHVLRGALEVVNQQVDKTFWQLSINVSIQVLSTALLLALFIVAFNYFPSNLVSQWPRGIVPQGMLLMSLAGAAGAILSNMLSKERFTVATGATSRYFAYHLLAKPVIGGFAGLMLLFLEQSQLLLSVVVRPEAEPPAQVSAPAEAGARNTAPTPAEPSEPDAPPEKTESESTRENNPAILHIHVGSRQAAFYTLVALAIVAGFSADKLLNSVMDRVLRKLLGQSEKVLPPSAPAGTPPPPEKTGAR